MPPINDQLENLSLDELSLLILTNDGSGPILWQKNLSLLQRLRNVLFPIKKRLKYNTDSVFVLTTKETYIWGIIVSRIIQNNPEVSEKEIIEAYREVLNRNKEFLRGYYADLRPFYREFRLRESNYFFDRIFYDTIQVVEDRLQTQLNVREIEEAEYKTFHSLVDRGYIEDPVFTTIFGLSVAIAGFIPFGFTKKKRKGKVVYRKIEALFWGYLYDEGKGKDPTSITKIYFRLWKVLNAFKKALAETTAEEIDK